MTPPRSIYAAKLREFPSLAFVDEAAFAERGQWADHFGKRIGPAFDGRIVVEIGCADAAYLARIAAKHPSVAFVGIDWKYKAVYDGAARVADLRLPNVALLRGRGQDILKIFAPEEIDEAWVFHPDPCAREAELKNRLIAEPFLTDVHAALRTAGSTITLKTDHPGYYQWTLALFGLPVPDWFEHPTTASPRFRLRDLMLPQDIPQPNAAIQQRFRISAHSANFWNDPAATTHAARRLFANETTLFESRFVKKRFPIYYVEMSKI